MNEAPDMRQLAAILDREFRIADAYHSQLARLQRQAFEYYEAQPFGNEVEGRSQIILPDVQEATDYMNQSVLRTFVSGDHTVEFEATDEADEEAAGEATAAMNYIFMRQQDGYRILYDCLNDGLLRKIGIIKTVMETVEKVHTERVQVDPVQLGMMPDEVEVVEATDNGDGTVTATIKHHTTEKRFVDYAVPTVEFRFIPQARHEDHADYIAHVCEKTRSDLIEMGFDREQVYRLPAHSRPFVVNRNESDRLDQYITDETTPALEKVLLCEEYPRIDMDGDGIAERLKIYRVETEILIEAETGKPSIETVEEQPFAVFCPFPRAHRLVGYSLADKVMDIQLARSFVARQMFDGMAFANMPRPVVDTNMADVDTMNDLLSPIPGSPIRVKGGVAAVQPFQSGFDIGKSMQAMEWLTGERESRTGITRLNQGLDADALNKTATGTALMQSQGQQQEEMIARQLAETVGRLFCKKYRLMRAEGVPIKVKVDGQYKTVDPSTWPEDINMVVRVGLGSGSKDKRIQARMALIPIMAEGLPQGLVTPKHTFNMIDGLVRDMGIGQGDDFWLDPDAPPELDESGQPKQPVQKPDPAMMELQAKQQQAAAQLQLDQQKAQAAQELEGQKAAASIETERQKADAQISMQRDKHALEMQQRREQAGLEAQLARERMVMEAQLEREAIALKAQTDVHIASNRPGGSLDA